jgi:hypothetical protein
MRLYVASATTVAELPAVGVALEKNKPVVFLPLKNFVKEYKTAAWIQVAVPISGFNIKPSLTGKINTIGFRQQSNDNKEHIIFIDDVELVNENVTSVTTSPKLISAKGFEKHVDVTWEPVTDTAKILCFIL